jgi:hypothetical protein
MTNARPFSIFTLQDLSNDTKNTSMRGVWAFLSNSKHSGVPEDSKSPTLEVLGFTPTLGQSGVATTLMARFLNFELVVVVVRLLILPTS